MQKEIMRKRKLPAFKTDLGGLEYLLDKLASLFPDAKCSSSITITLKNQDIQFESVDEIRQTRELPDRVTSFHVWVSHGKQRVSFHPGPGGFAGPAAFIIAEGDNEAWCAGAIETASQYFQQNRAWYSWFRGWPLGVLGLLVAYALPFLMVIGGLSLVLTPKIVISWLVALLVLGALYFGRGFLLPSAMLEIRLTESMIERHASELTLLISVLALLLTIIGWFIKGVR